VRVWIVQTGTANTASVVSGLRRVGAEPVVAGQEEVDVAALPEAVATAERLVLPGVGAFGAARAALEEIGVVEALAERVRAGRPTLGICLGLQLLFEASEESPGVAGLGVLPGAISRFPDTVRVPQFGWNRVTPQGEGLVRPGYAYFANSYLAVRAPEGWVASTAEHGGPFVAAVQRGAVLACQFHPELSGAWGLDLLARWLGASC